jgi:hypothetical protein
MTRNKLADFIESAIMSNTTVADSIYKADGLRVGNCILGYAYKLKYALMDIPGPFRSSSDKKLGGKTFDKRTIIGGAVDNRHAGRKRFVIALDFASQYPSQKQGSNIDGSARVDNMILQEPAKYGLTLYKEIKINDSYGERKVYVLKASE